VQNLPTLRNATKSPAVAVQVLMNRIVRLCEALGRADILLIPDTRKQAEELYLAFCQQRELIITMSRLGQNLPLTQDAALARISYLSSVCDRLITQDWRFRHLVNRAIANNMSLLEFYVLSQMHDESRRAYRAYESELRAKSADEKSRSAKIQRITDRIKSLNQTLEDHQSLIIAIDKELTHLHSELLTLNAQIPAADSTPL
jgi:hypothetical protein